MLDKRIQYAKQPSWNKYKFQNVCAMFMDSDYMYQRSTKSVAIMNIAVFIFPIRKYSIYKIMQHITSFSTDFIIFSSYGISDRGSLHLGDVQWFIVAYRDTIVT